MEFEDTVQEIRALDDDSFAPPRVDLASAITEGRRRRRTRKVAAGAISVVAVAAVLAAVPVGIDLVTHGRAPRPSHVTVAGGSSPAPSAVAKIHLSCVEQRLPVLVAGQQSVVTGGDPSGRYQLGRVYDGPRPTKLVIWDNGTIAHTVAMPGNDASLTAINTAGVAVGRSFLTSSTNSEVSWIYANGTLNQLPAGDDSLAAQGISDTGIIAGTEQTAGNVDYPIEWRTASTKAQRLALPGSDWVGQVEAIDADGTIVGTVRPREGSPTDRGMIWQPDGTSRLLPLPPFKGVNGLRIDSISRGVIVAEAEIVSARSESFIPVTFTIATGEYTRLVGANMWTSSGNSRGWLAGMVGVLGKKLLGQAPAVFVPGTGIVRLPMLSTRVQQPNEARWISEDGHLVTGQDADSKGVIHAVEWRCR